MESVSNWNETPVQSIVSNMMELNSIKCNWDVENWEGENSLWGHLASSCWSLNSITNRMYLYIIWKDNKNEIQEIFSNKYENSEQSDNTLDDMSGSTDVSTEDELDDAEFPKSEIEMYPTVRVDSDLESSTDSCSRWSLDSAYDFESQNRLSTGISSSNTHDCNLGQKPKDDGGQEVDKIVLTNDHTELKKMEFIEPTGHEIEIDSSLKLLDASSEMNMDNEKSYRREDDLNSQESRSIKVSEEQSLVHRTTEEYSDDDDFLTKPFTSHFKKKDPATEIATFPQLKDSKCETVPLPFDSNFTTQDAHRLLIGAKTDQISTCNDFGKISDDTVFVFDTKVQNSKPYWRNDGEQWKSTRGEKIPRRCPIIYKRVCTLVRNNLDLPIQRHEYWDINGGTNNIESWCPSRVVVHYKGNFKGYDFPKGHLIDVGMNEIKEPENCQNKEPYTGIPLPFKSTLKETLRKIDEELSKEGGVRGKKLWTKMTLEANRQELRGNKGFQPRNVDQIYNREKKLKRNRPIYNNDLGDLATMSREYPDIIPKFTFSPVMKLMTVHLELLQHITDFFQFSDGYCFHYDTTFNFGKYFVSFLSIRHPGSDEFPTVPLIMLCHTFTDKENTHRPFFKKVSKLLKCFDRKRNILITDREKSVIGAVRETMTKINSVYCYNHLRKNVQRWTSKQYKSKTTARALQLDIKNLLWAKNEAEFEKYLEDCRPNTPEESEIDESCDIDDETYEITEKLVEFDEKEESELLKSRRRWDCKFLKHYLKYLDTDIRSSFRGKVVKFGIFNQYSGITNNPSESMNKRAKHDLFADGAPSTLYDTVHQVYDWQSAILYDMHLSLSGDCSNYNVRKRYHGKLDKLPPIIVPDSTLIFRTELREPDLPSKLQRIEDDVNCDVKVRKANSLVDAGLVEVIGKGYYKVANQRRKVNAQGKAEHIVHLFNNTCDCLNTRCVHLLAVSIFTGAFGSPNGDFLKRTKPTDITTVYNKTAPKGSVKKGPGIRVKVIYEDPNSLSEIDSDTSDQEYDRQIRKKSPTSRGHVNVQIFPQTGNSYWERRSSTLKSTQKSLNIFNEIPFIPWGNDKTEKFNFTFSNTCTIDNVLFTLSAIFKWFPDAQKYMEIESRKSEISNSIVNTVEKILSRNFNEAKLTWIQHVQKVTPVAAAIGINDLWGSEEEKSLIPMKIFFRKYIEVLKCSEHGIIRQQIEAFSSYSRASMKNTLLEIHGQTLTRNRIPCAHEDCCGEVQRTISTPKDGPLPFAVFHVSDKDVENIPRKINLLGTGYMLFAVSLFQERRKHFVAAFPWQDQWLIYDGLKERMEIGLPRYLCVSLTWYIRND